MKLSIYLGEAYDTAKGVRAEKANKITGGAAKIDKRSLDVMMDTISSFCGGDNQNWFITGRTIGNAPELRDHHPKDVSARFIKKLTGEARAKIQKTSEKSVDMEVIMETLRKAYGGAVGFTKQLVDSHIIVGKIVS